MNSYTTPRDSTRFSVIPLVWSVPMRSCTDPPPAGDTQRRRWLPWIFTSGLRSGLRCPTSLRGETPFFSPTGGDDGDSDPAVWVRPIGK
jgi:hypothetical protein